MTEENDHSREDAISYIKSWKESLELRRKEIYSKYLSGAMHGITFTTNAQLQLLKVERTILLEQKSHLDRDQMASLEQSLTSGHDEAQQYFPYSYRCIVLAVLFGVIGFFTILVRA